MSTFAINPVYQGVWKQVANPAKPGTFLPSYYPGGHLEGAIAPGGQESVTATYLVTGLTQGYYAVGVYYDAMPGNAKAVTVCYKTANSTGALPIKLDETTGTPDVVGAKPVNGVLPVHTVVTPYRISNAASYIWVPKVSGSCTVQITICDPYDVPGRLLVADTIMLTLISTTK